MFDQTTDPERLAAIRQERRDNSRYASLRQCRMELAEVEAMFRKNPIRCHNTPNCYVQEFRRRSLISTA